MVVPFVASICCRETVFRARSRRRSLTAIGFAVGVAVLLLLSVPVALSPTPRGDAPSVPSAAHVPATLLRPSAPAIPSAGAEHPAAVAPADVPCYSLNGTICVSVENSTFPNIIPAPGSHVSSVEPLPNTTINLWVRSQTNLVWSARAPTSGKYSPLALNATGVLWNGDPFYAKGDATMWNPPGNVWWNYGPVGVNKTYPYYYGLSFPARSPTGGPNFFAGMTLHWWIYFVQNTSGVYSHWSTESLNFTFTFGGAWPASPYPGSHNFAGAAAATEDLEVVRIPSSPNFNDTVNLTVSTTPLDLPSSATIGGAYVDLTESAPDGAILNATTLTFPVTPQGNVGAIASTIVLPASWARSPGALVTYRISAWDMSAWAVGQVGPDLVTTQPYNYTVHGNGTFATGLFSDDLAFTTNPVGPGLGGGTLPTVPAGAAVHLDLASRNPTTAIEAGEILLSLTDAGINATVSEQITLHRVNSTDFVGAIPPLPLGSDVSFEVVAWDFSQNRELSGQYQYVTPTLSQLLPTIPPTSTFFVVYVYDNGTGQWVSGADVSVLEVESSGYVVTHARTFGGVAYPNATGAPFVPLLLSAGATFRIYVNDSSFLPAGQVTAPSVVVTLVLPHAPSGTGVLVAAPNYVVAQAGPSIYFWLNQSVPAVAYATPEGLTGAALVGAALGLGALTLAGVPLFLWWARIRARRAEQERRVTL